MLSVLIVQSEYEDCLRLRSLIDWERLEVEKVELCCNGIDALEHILTGWPHVVFTDVRLPGMDGIELIRRCREHGIACHFIVVSKWRRFEYAQSVMRFGVEEYLVKPVSAEELTRVVISLVKQQRAANAGDMTELLQKTRILLRNSFMEPFTSQELQTEMTIENLNEKYHFNLQEGLFRAAIICLADLPEFELGIFLSGLVQNVRARFDPLCYEMIPYVRRNERLTLIFNYSKQSGAEQHFKDLLDIVREHLHKRDCEATTFCIGIGSPESDISGLTRTLDTAERAVRCGILRERNRMYCYGELRFDQLSAADILTPTLIDEMCSAVALLDSDSFVRALRSAFAPVSTYTDPSVIIDICNAAAAAIFDITHKDGYESVTKESRIAEMQKLAAQTSLADTVNSICAWCVKQIDLCQEERRNSRPVRDAIRYINEHYMDPLTLEHISEHVHLNASYFSIIFKKQTGRNFSDYLTWRRMEAARKLLRDSSLSVAAVCEAVGYSDSKYFSRVFTRLVGIKPSAYRMLHG